MRQKSLILIFLGLSGCGKGTQAELLVKKYDFAYLAMGNLLREEAIKPTKLGKTINELINTKGELVPDNLTTQLFQQELKKKKNQGRIIIDGYPRTLAQAHNLEGIFKELGFGKTLAIHVKISEDEAMRRLTRRMTCPKCKKTHLPNEKKCRECGGKLVRRSDDVPKKIKARIAWGKKELTPVIDFYRKNNQLFEVSGERTIEKINEDIVEEIEKYL